MECNMKDTKKMPKDEKIEKAKRIIQDLNARSYQTKNLRKLAGAKNGGNMIIVSDQFYRRMNPLSPVRF